MKKIKISGVWHLFYGKVAGKDGMFHSTARCGSSTPFQQGQLVDSIGKRPGANAMSGEWRCSDCTALVWESK